MSKETGNRLKKVAKKLYDGNQSKMARDMDMSPQAANKYFQGDRDPGIKILKRLVSIGVNVTWVIKGIEPMLIKDIKEVRISRVTVQDSNLAEEMAEEFTKQANEGGEQNYFSEVEAMNLNEAERSLLDEVKQFSTFLDTRPLNPHVKRLLLELLIESIDRAIEQPPHEPTPSGDA